MTECLHDNLADLRAENEHIESLGKEIQSAFSMIQKYVTVLDVDWAWILPLNTMIKDVGCTHDVVRASVRFAADYMTKETTFLANFSTKFQRQEQIDYVESRIEKIENSLAEIESAIGIVKPIKQRCPVCHVYS